MPTRTELELCTSPAPVPPVIYDDGYVPSDQDIILQIGHKDPPGRNAVISPRPPEPAPPQVTQPPQSP